MKNSNDKRIRQLQTIAKNAKIKMALNSSRRSFQWLAVEAFGLKEIPEEFRDKTFNNINTDVELFLQHETKKIENRIQESNNNQTKLEDTKQINLQRYGHYCPAVRYNEQFYQEIEKQLKHSKKKSTFNPKYPDQRATLLTQASHGCNQIEAAKTLFENIYEKHFTGQQLIAQAGAGKTYVYGSVIKNFIERGLIGDCLSPWPILIVTKASVVEQTKKVLQDDFNIDTTLGTVQVVNIEALRAALLDILIEKELKIEYGEEIEFYRWRKVYRPRLIIWDESQILAREFSIQSKIASALHDELNPPYETFEVFSSATPYSRVSEAKVFAVSTKKSIQIGTGEKIVSNSSWPMVSKELAYPAEPEDYVTASINRFVDEFEPYIVRIRNIRPKHRAYNKIVPMDFQTKEEREEYYKAVDLHEKRKRRIESDDSMNEGQRRMAMLAEFTIFRKAAENCKRFHYAKWMDECYKLGYAPALGLAFKQTITNVVRLLIEDYNWKREDITLIWGGSTEALSIKRKLALKIKKSQKLQEDLWKELDIDVEEDLGIFFDDIEEKTNEQVEFEKRYRLQSQKPHEREEERLRFQRQDSKGALFSYKSGGVGLSLHHEEQYPKARPRRGRFSLVYSEKELIQCSGRLPRITSISDTYQDYDYYKNTIEEHVAARVRMKLKCMHQVIRAREDWTDIITGMPKQMKEYEKLTEAADESENVGDVTLLNEYAGD
jgi:hypothetical protein